MSERHEPAGLPVEIEAGTGASPPMLSFDAFFAEQFPRLVDSGPTDPRAQLHLGLDPAAGFEVVQAMTSTLGADGRPPGTVAGPEGRSTSEAILFGGTDPTVPPWFLVTVTTTENPTGPWGEPYGNEEATTIAGRPAVLRSYGLPTPTGREWTVATLKWDDHNAVNARFWAVDVDAASAALATLHLDDTGRWTITSPPIGLHELARDIEDTAPGWYQDGSSYIDTSSGSTPLSPSLSIVRTAGTRTEPELVARALGSSWEQSTTIERTTVRGQAAIIVTPGRPEPMSLGPVPRYRVLWFEPEHDAIVDLVVFDADRAEVDRVVASLREVDAATWRSTLARCTHVMHGGTIDLQPDGVTGGICPGHEPVGG